MALEVKYHFCYGATNSKHLQQGDILEKTELLKEILREVHPHYLDESYTRFIILSQTCDLVRRGGNDCKTRYITLGVIRPLSLLLEREIEKHQDDFDKTAIVCKNSAKSKLTQFLERLFNNNEPEYFYIEPQPEVGLSEPSCAFLRLSISIRAYQHYDTCFKARKLSLSEGFRAKLGWMIGNVYSRVGTEDWVPGTLKKEEFSKKIKNNLESLSQWVDDQKLEYVKKEFISESKNIINLLNPVIQEYTKILLFQNLLFINNSNQLIFCSIFEDFIVFFEDFSKNPEELFRVLINKAKLPTKKDDVIESIRRILQGFDGFEDVKIEKICNRISNDQIVSRHLK